jgi:hypothetical protein
MNLLESKLSLVHLETETRMRIAELAAQIATVPGPGSMIVDRKVFNETYHEICNMVLTSLIETKEDVVSELYKHTV